MLIYFCTFFISFIFAYEAELKFKKGKKKAGKFFSLLAISIPCFLASFRAVGVGTDTHSYIKNVFDICLKSNDFVQAQVLVAEVSNVEFLYVLMNYVISRFTSSVGVVYFASQFLIQYFVYRACYDNRFKLHKYSVAYLVFMILFFNKSLNMTRQSIAIAIILFSSKYLFEKKPIKYVVLCLVASLFHQAAIFFMLLYPINYMINNGKMKNWIKVLIFIFALMFVVWYDQIIMLLVTNLGLNARYLLYINTDGGIIKIELFLKIIVLIVSLFYKLYNSKDIRLRTYFYFLVLDLVLYFVGLKASYAYRFSYYFYYFTIFVIPYFIYHFKKRENKVIISIIVITLLMSYSFVYYGYHRLDETVPYRTVFQGD